MPQLWVVSRGGSVVPLARAAFVEAAVGAAVFQPRVLFGGCLGLFRVSEFAAVSAGERAGPLPGCPPLGAGEMVLGAGTWQR